jgi:hypothetical protein
MYNLASGAKSSCISRRWRVGSVRRISSIQRRVYRPKSGDKPTLGSVKLEADTKVAIPDRLVNFQQMRIVEANFRRCRKSRSRR